MLEEIPSSFFIWNLTETKSAMSMANATKVMVAARKETNEARRTMVTWEKRERMNARVMWY